jgi:hypothetical protein
MQILLHPSLKSLPPHSIRSSKNRLMISRKSLNRALILGFMVLVGYCLAKSIQVQSVIGIILALTSLGASVYFLYLVVMAKENAEREETI